MSALLFFASDTPFEELPNPHERIISINEALALGAKIPDYVLKGDFDRDKPMLLYMDREIHINIDTKEIEDGNFDNDFSIWPFPPMEVSGIHTTKPYCAELSWQRYTDGRAKNIIAYIKAHMQKAEEMEIWHVWLDDAETPVFKRKEYLLSELTVDTVKEIEEVPLTVEPLVHYCYRIKR
ncbi:MAG: hypothetical protein IJY52_02640 [Anaerotignum sp.]|nr:hypothetical protein [Anaerotignum sp.]